jgi:hypothetical protein
VETIQAAHSVSAVAAVAAYLARVSAPASAYSAAPLAGLSLAGFPVGMTVAAAEQAVSVVSAWVDLELADPELVVPALVLQELVAWELDERAWVDWVWEQVLVG